MEAWRAGASLSRISGFQNSRVRRSSSLSQLGRQSFCRGCTGVLVLLLKAWSSESEEEVDVVHLIHFEYWNQKMKNDDIMTVCRLSFPPFGELSTLYFSFLLLNVSFDFYE